MKILDRSNQEIKIGDKVEHFDRKDFHSFQTLPEYIGKVIAINENDLPLVTILIQGENRKIPHFDLIHTI